MVKSLVERLYRRHRVSVAETDFHDLRQRAEIGVASVGTSRHRLERQMDAIRRLIDEQEEAVLLGWEPEYLEAGQ